MDIKKYLQQKADEDAEKLITQEDEDFYQSLLREVEANSAAKAVPQKSKSTLWGSVAGVTAAAVVAVAITVPLCINTNSSITYEEGNISERVVTVSEMCADLNYFDFVQLAEEGLVVKLKFDTLSNDNLFYDVALSTGFAKIKLQIVINENYNYDFEMKGEQKTEVLNDYSITYVENQISSDIAEIYDIDFRGYITLQTETVYIDYYQSPGFGEEEFFTTIQSIIKVK